MSSSRVSSLDDNPYSTEEAKARFLKARELFKGLDQASQLQNRIHEFLQTQNTFHENMGQLAMAVQAEVPQRENKPGHSEIKQLGELYAELSINPFKHFSSEDIVLAIDGIRRVIHPQNLHFSRIIKAMAGCISLAKFTEQLVIEYSENPESQTRLLGFLECQSWTLASGYFDKPFQLLTRYSLLLHPIQAELKKIVSPATDELVASIQSAIEYIEPSVDRINDNQSILEFLSMIEEVLTQLKSELASPTLLEKFVAQTSPSSDAQSTPLPPTESPIESEAMTLELNIEAVLLSLRTAKENILSDQQNIGVLYRCLLELLNPISLELSKKYDAMNFTFTPEEWTSPKGLYSQVYSLSAYSAHFLWQTISSKPSIIELVKKLDGLIAELSIKSDFITRLQDTHVLLSFKGKRL